MSKMEITIVSSSAAYCKDWEITGYYWAVNSKTEEGMSGFLNSECLFCSIHNKHTKLIPVPLSCLRVEIKS